MPRGGTATDRGVYAAVGARPGRGTRKIDAQPQFRTETPGAVTEVQAQPDGVLVETHSRPTYFRASHHWVQGVRHPTGPPLKRRCGRRPRRLPDRRPGHLPRRKGSEFPSTSPTV